MLLHRVRWWPALELVCCIATLEQYAAQARGVARAAIDDPCTRASQRQALPSEDTLRELLQLSTELGVEDCCLSLVYEQPEHLADLGGT